MEIQFSGEMVTSIEAFSLFRFLLNLILKPQFPPKNGMVITTNSQYMNSWIVYLFACLYVYCVCLLHNMLPFPGKSTPISLGRTDSLILCGLGES